MTVALRQEIEQPADIRAEARARAYAMLVGHCGVIGSLTDDQLSAVAAMSAGEPQEVGCHSSSDIQPN